MFFGEDALVSFQLPFAPVFYNPNFREGLTASGMRHETRWYEAEHRWLADVRKCYPGLSGVADHMRLELYGVFCKQAEMMGPGKYVDGARRRFKEAFKTALRKGVVQGSVEEFLSELDPNDYLGSRLLLSHAISKLGW